MIVICEECGQKYELDPSIMTRRKAKIKCKSCNYLNTIYKPGEGPDSIKDVTSDDLLMAPPPAESFKPAPSKRASPGEKEVKILPAEGRMGMIGLRGKLMFFFLVPLFLALAIGGLFMVRQMNVLGKAMTGESLRMLTNVAENEVLEYSKAIAQQAQIYLAGHPDLKKEDFNNDMEFRKIAVQRITLTMRGYTALYGPNENGKLVFWAHANPKYVGREIGMLKDIIGAGFDDFNKLLRIGPEGKESVGHYMQETEGRPRDNFMVCTPVKGTPYYLSSTTYLDESTLGVVAIPISPAFKNYLDLTIWPQDNEWWKKKEQRTYAFVTLDYPPLEYAGDDGKAQGIAVEIATRIMNKLGQTLDIKVNPWARSLEMVKSGEADAIFTVFKNPERETFLDFSRNVLIPQIVYLYARKGAPIAFDGNLEKLKNETIGVVSTISYGQKFDQLKPQLKTERVETLEQNFKKLQLGRIDLVISNVYTAEATLFKMNLQNEFIRLSPAVEDVPSYIGFSKKRELTALRDLFDQELLSMKARGEFDEVLKKYNINIQQQK